VCAKTPTTEIGISLTFACSLLFLFQGNEKVKCKVFKIYYFSLLKTLFSSFCPYCGWTLDSKWRWFSLESHSTHEFIDPYASRILSLLDTNIDHQNMRKYRFLRIFKTLCYHGMRPTKMTGLTWGAPRVISRSSGISVHYIEPYQSSSPAIEYRNF
jgi:hypothetical protein